MSAAPDREGLLRETLLFDWSKWNSAVAWRSTPAMALSLAAGIAIGNPGAGLVAAAGAFTTGLGSLQKIRGSYLIPMLLAAVGMALSTFVGMTIGHQSLWFVALAGIWAAMYALLTAMKGGTSWVAQQWTVWFLVSGAFHTAPRAASMRCELILAGGCAPGAVAQDVQVQPRFGNRLPRRPRERPQLPLAAHTRLSL
jgi:hypothetical protein